MKRESNINRREALKMLGIGAGLTFGTGVTGEEVQKKQILSRPSSHKKARIVIVGGGTAGMIAAARTRRAAPNAQIVLIAPNEIHLYQSGQLFVAAGLAKSAENRRKTADLLPDNVTWVKDQVIAFDPRNNQLETEKNGKVVYDVLVVALGSQYDYSAISGLSDDMIGKEGIASLYLNDTVAGSDRGAEMTYEIFGRMRDAAKTANKPIEILFCEPDTPVKGQGSALSMLLLTQHQLRNEGLDKRVRFTYAMPQRQILPLDGFDRVVHRVLAKHHNIQLLPRHTLRSIDAKKKKATFQHADGMLEKSYDFLHITPPLRAPEVMRSSPLVAKEGAQKGWMAVDVKTLRHPEYENIFGLGDVIALDYAKSGGAAQHQGIILQDNIAAALEGDKLEYFYDGYTVSPIVTAYGKVLLAEYNKKKALPTFVLNPYEPRVLWWWLQRYFMPWAYFNLLMRGMM